MERANKGLVLVDIESPYGSDAAPAADTESIITKGMPTFEVVGNPRMREIPLAYFGNVAPVNVGEALKLNFVTELKGSGTAGSVSRYGVLFRACNFTQAINAGTSVVYTPNSTMEGESVSLYFHMDGTLHKILGAVGNVVFKFTAQEILIAEWSFTGLYAGDHASTVTFPTATHEAIAPTICKSGSFTYNSVSDLVISELTLDMGNVVSKQMDVNAATGIGRYFVSNRESKGTMNPEKEALATLNPWTIYNATTQANIAIGTFGASAGNRVALAITGAVLEPPKYGNRENVAVWDLSFTLNPTLSAGNAEAVITFT